MRKSSFVAFFLLLLLGLYGCGTSQTTTDNAPIALTASIQEGSLTSSSAVLVLENTSEAYTYEYGNESEFGLEQKVGNEWQTVEQVRDIDTTADLYILLPGETREETVNLEQKYGSLSAGEYRIIKVVNEVAADEYEEGERTERTIYVNFTL